MPDTHGLLWIGDRITYFRAKAEMERWREAKEKIHCELANSVRGFQSLSDSWGRRGDPETALAGVSLSSQSFGYQAFAKRQSVMYAGLAHKCRETLKALKLKVPETGEIMADVVSRNRRRDAEENSFAVLSRIKEASQIATSAKLAL